MEFRTNEFLQNSRLATNALNDSLSYWEIRDAGAEKQKGMNDTGSSQVFENTKRRKIFIKELSKRIGVSENNEEYLLLELLFFREEVERNTVRYHVNGRKNVCYYFIPGYGSANAESTSNQDRRINASLSNEFSMEETMDQDDSLNLLDVAISYKMQEKSGVKYKMCKVKRLRSEVKSLNIYSNNIIDHCKSTPFVENRQGHDSDRTLYDPSTYSHRWMNNKTLSAQHRDKNADRVERENRKNTELTLRYREYDRKKCAVQKETAAVGKQIFQNKDDITNSQEYSKKTKCMQMLKFQQNIEEENSFHNLPSKRAYIQASDNTKCLDKATFKKLGDILLSIWNIDEFCHITKISIIKNNLKIVRYLRNLENIACKIAKQSYETVEQFVYDFRKIVYDSSRSFKVSSLEFEILQSMKIRFAVWLNIKFGNEFSYISGNSFNRFTQMSHQS